LYTLRSLIVISALATSLGGAIYAHQGGWDEILLVAGPIAVIVGLLRLAERRAERQRDPLPPVPLDDEDQPPS
jgi:MFS family permease